MAITASNTSTQRELIPAGNYVARCYQMIHIGTVEEEFQGEKKIMNKVRIGWELPEEQRIFREENGMQPCVISKEYTLSMHEKSTLRKILASWRGKDFTMDEAKAFDITNLLGVPCMLNIIHKPSKDNTKTYEEIGSISPIPKSLVCPAQINATQIWDYDKPNMEYLESLPDFIKNKIKTSLEYVALSSPKESVNDFYKPNPEVIDDLPF
jgi:hypothetical protein